MSAGGGFVSTEAVPPIGARIQMAARADRQAPSVWMHLRVTWINVEETDEHPHTGFGGYWLHASSRYGEEKLRDFLSSVLGITKPVVRPMTPPAGGDVVSVYRFPDVYDSDDMADFPWEVRERVEPRSGGSVKLVGQANKKKASGARKRSSAPKVRDSNAGIREESHNKPSRPAAFSADTMAMLDAGSPLVAAGGDLSDSGLQALVNLTHEEPLTVEHSSADLSSAGLSSADLNSADILVDLSGPDSADLESGSHDLGLEGGDDPARTDATTSDGGGRWSFLVKKLGGLRFGGGGSADPVQVSFDGAEFVVKYKMGKKFYDAAVERMDRTSMVLRPGADIPDLWSRIELSIPTGRGRKAKALSVHATVTRIKDTGEDPLVTCKINRVDERGMKGAFSSYIQAFKDRADT